MKHALILVLLVVLVAGMASAQPKTSGRVVTAVTTSWDSTALNTSWTGMYGQHWCYLTHDGSADTLLVAFNNDTTSAKEYYLLAGETQWFNSNNVQFVRRKASANTIKSRLISW